MKILVIGHARHGKDTLCDMLAKEGYAFKPTSEIYMNSIVWPIWSGQYRNKDEAITDKVNRRQELFQIIRSYNSPDRSKLTKLVLSQSDIYSGMRARIEFEASKHLFDLILWVDAEKRLPLESADSFQLDKSDAQVVLDNNLSENHLQDQVNNLISLIKTLQGK